MHAHVLIAIYVLLATATALVVQQRSVVVCMPPRDTILLVYSARSIMFTVTQSRRWFAREVSCWITQKKVPTSWEDAQRRCERYGAVLASPLNTPLYNYLQSRINDVYNDTAAYFIGTRAQRSDNGQEVSYVSVEGRQLDDMPMAVFDAIKQLDLEQGDCLSMDGHRIRAVSCWDHLPYICYSNETAECGSASTGEVSKSASTLPPPRTIPGYTYYPATRSSYKFHDRYATWDIANTTCAGEGAHLLVLNDAEEVDIVTRIVRDAFSDYRATWTGLRDNRPGGGMDWRTVHGEPLSDVYNVWGDGRPYNDAGRTCADFYTGDKRLYDVYCDWSRYFTCEISQW